MRERTAVIGAVALALLLLAAVVLPRLWSSPPHAAQPPVLDMLTRPEITWSSEAGAGCQQSRDQDLVVLSDGLRVWALDLINGRTLWKVDPMRGDVVCLPETNLVAVTQADPSDGRTKSTVFLDGASGRQVAERQAASAAQVAPLGELVGLVDSANVLSAVHPDDLDEVVWQRQLPGPEGGLGPLYVSDVDDDVVQLTYYPEHGGDGDRNGYVLPLRTSDGAPPPWAPTSPSEQSHHTRVGDVIVRFTFADDDFSIRVLDLDGQELWTVGGDQLVPAGSRLFLSSTTGPDGRGGHLREVDPRTGRPRTTNSHEEPFDFAIPLSPTHIGVISNNTMLVLDEELQGQPTTRVENFRNVLVGQTVFYAESQTNDETTRITAIDPAAAKVLWTLDLAPGQRVEQLGRHVMVIDDDGTLHGLQET